MISSKFFNDHEFDENKSFAVDLKMNGDLNVGALKDENFFINLNFAPGLSIEELNNKYCHSNRDNDLVNIFKSLLEFSFKTLGKYDYSFDIENQEFKGFKVRNICLKNDYCLIFLIFYLN